MNQKFYAFVAIVFAAVTASAEAHADPVVLKIGTLAPAQSPWGKVFKTWSEGLKKRTEGKIELQFFWGGTQGDEIAMAGKIRNGQLDGAAFTATGLAQFNRDVLALQLPGLVGSDWAKLDRAREAVKPMLEPEFTKQKVTLLGWGDVGIAHLMSKGKGVASPDDLKSLHPYALPGDPIGKAFLTRLGVPAQTVQVTEIGHGLSSGRVDVVNSPAIAAEQLQWASHLEYVNPMASGIGIGGLLFSSDKLAALPADLKEALVDTGAKAAKALTARIRNEDSAAFERLKGKLKVVESSEADKAAWAKIFAAVRSDVCGPTLKAEVCTAIQNAVK